MYGNKTYYHLPPPVSYWVSFCHVSVSMERNIYLAYSLSCNEPIYDQQFIIKYLMD